MSKGRSAFRLHTASGQDNPRSIGDTMSALIREAHRQNSKETNQLATSAPTSRTSHFVGGGSPMLPEALRGLLRETEPTRRISDLVLPRQIVGDLQDLVGEIRETALLRSDSLKPPALATSTKSDMSLSFILFVH